VAIEACRQLKARGVDFHYRILGIGPWERRLRTLIEQYQLEDVVECRASSPATRSRRCSMRQMFPAAFRNGSRWRYGGIPVALMEAMAVRIPVVSTIHSGIPELIKSDHSGWLVPENNAMALADRLAAFSDIDQQALEPVLHNARQKVEADFNQQVINRQLASLLQTL
jgi:colanic acid/amylovoran biosynthesis glycosyltransferase